MVATTEVHTIQDTVAYVQDHMGKAYSDLPAAEQAAFSEQLQALFTEMARTDAEKVQAMVQQPVVRHALMRDSIDECAYDYLDPYGCEVGTALDIQQHRYEKALATIGSDDSSTLSTYDINNGLDRSSKAYLAVQSQWDLVFKALTSLIKS